MQKSALIVVFFLLTSLLGNLAFGAEKKRKLNVVFFLVDDLGWSDVGCFGSSFYETPHIDRLAKEGVKFTSGYAACHVCSPTRASILTGKYPATMNLTEWLNGRSDRPYQVLLNPGKAMALDPKESTLAEALEEISLLKKEVYIK
jgi:arylsulfatase A-like enzyme